MINQAMNASSFSQNRFYMSVVNSDVMDLMAQIREKQALKC